MEPNVSLQIIMSPELLDFIKSVLCAYAVASTGARVLPLPCHRDVKHPFFRILLKFLRGYKRMDKCHDDGTPNNN
jgi:hypothetical protein